MVDYFETSFTTTKGQAVSLTIDLEEDKPTTTDVQHVAAFLPAPTYSMAILPATIILLVSVVCIAIGMEVLAPILIRY